jgi:hypothetical protein
MPFTAQYPGTCAGCEDKINEGDLVNYVDDELEHVVCPQPKRALGQVCARCMTIHTGEC